jgi:hypothetical protein
MASIVLSGVGAAIGGIVAGPFGAQIGYGLGSIAGNIVQPGGENYEVSGARMADLSIQTSTYGKSIPILFGQSRFAGNVIWSLPIKEHENRSESSTGGKGGGGRRTSVTNVHYTYSITLAIGICEGVAEHFVNSHNKGDRFILLDHKITELEMPIPLIGVTNDYFVVPDGGKIEASEKTQFTWNANILKPLSPVHLFYEEVYDEEIKISWTRRSRIGGMMRNNVDVMMDEGKECYEVDCMLGDRVIDIIKTQTSHATCPKNLFKKLSKIRVHQISSSIGRGFGAELYVK